MNQRSPIIVGVAALLALSSCFPPPASPYPFTQKLDCGTVTISIGGKGEIVFDFKVKRSEKCTCKEFGWIQHISDADEDAWRYDNGVLSGVTTPKRIGAKSDPSKANQPTTPPTGTELKDWDANPWYGGTTDPAAPKDFGEHPTPQTHISDRPDAPNTKYKTQAGLRFHRCGLHYMGVGTGTGRE